MSIYYNEKNLDGIKKELQKDLDRDSTLYEAWKNVSYPTKKDGKPYAVMSKNFKNAYYKSFDYAMQPGEFELKVSENSKSTGAYYDDKISLYETICYMKDPVKLAKTENYVPKQPYLKQIYQYDLEDIKEAVNKKIKHYEKQIEKDKQQLEIAEKAYMTFLDAYYQALDKLKEVTGDPKENRLYDMVNGTICSNYPFC